MKIVFKDNKFYVKADSHLVSKLQRKGFNFDKSTGLWFTPFIENMRKIVGSSKLQKFEQLYADRISKSMSLYGDTLKIPIPTGRSLFPFQQAGVEYMVSCLDISDGGILLADEMGIGKTIQFIALCNYLGSQTGIIIVPASLKTNWLNEWLKWSTQNRRLTIDIAQGNNFPDSDFVIINYDIITRHIDAISSRKWDIAALDEAHYIKNYKAKRTRAIVGERGKFPGVKAPVRVVITGTPILNRPIELFMPLKWAFPQGFFNQLSYASRYCDAKRTPFGWDFTGASHLDELQNMLRSTIMCRRLKSSVLPQLPAKTRQVIEIDANSQVKRRLKHEHKFCEQKGLFDDDFNEVIKNMSNMRKSLMFDEIAEERRLNAIDKVPYVIEHLENLIESGQKVVCFAWHKEVIKMISEHFNNDLLTITGNTPIQQRQKQVDIFQNIDRYRLLIGNIKAAGVGFTMTAANVCVFCELPWTPGEVTQAEDRLHRIGQDSNVLVQHLVFRGSIDALMAKAIVRKQEIIEKAVDKKLTREEEILL